ncbi:hypothetical protein [Endozoicomonas elysicola]|uniref:Fungal lipase-like domain-containing protein n=1 Tax=Endozoicomonas elysicola TaxID=305900 RepID=A0A081KFS2_9GAMM|nr:hypothetical protein [Endozoicomonas elysicola]KEI72998.1 hypothetical protein GV64_21785 [Endozoicomonas elysicola]
MRNKKYLLLTTISFVLFAISLFSIAEAPPDSEISADWIETPEKTQTDTESDDFDSLKVEEEFQPQETIKKTVGYRVNREQLSERYPYALMSYLAEMDSILDSEKQERQLFVLFRLAYLGEKGFQLIADPDAIPEKWRPHFIATREQTVKAGKKSHQIVGQASIPNSNIKIRVFKQTEDPLSESHTENKIILALSGEKSNEALQCLVSEPKPSPQASKPSCSQAEKQLQEITDLAASLKEMYPYHSMEITGYSYSGAIVQVVMSTATFIDQAYIFNSYGVHPSWIETMPEEGFGKIHHSYVEGSFLHGQDYNLFSRYSRWGLPKNKVIVPGMKIASSGQESHIRQIYKLNHHDSWLDAFYNFATNIWILHSKEAVLRVFEANLNLDFPW